MSMIFAHAPIIFPAVLSVRVPYHKGLWLPLVMLHAGLAVRVGTGLFLGATQAWQVGGVVTVLAVLIFVVMTVAGVTICKLRDDAAAKSWDDADAKKRDDATAKSRSTKKASRVRALRDYIPFIWLLAALIIALASLLFSRNVTSRDWLLIHLVMLGALSHSVLVWSEHFAQTLLKTRITSRDTRSQNARIALLFAGGLAVMIGFPTQTWGLVLAGAITVSLSVLWHLAVMLIQARRALPGRYRIVVRYYAAAACMLPVGATFGAILAFGVPDSWRARLIIAHMAVNLLGWIGLTITGTLVTFWATIIRTKMDPNTVAWAQHSLAPLIGAIAVIVGGALAGNRIIAAIGLAAYALALAWWAQMLWKPLRAKGLNEFAPASVAFGLVWGCVAIIWAGAVLIRAHSWPLVTDMLQPIALIAVAGCALQVLLGALTYLIPTMFGGGASIVRLTTSAFHAGATVRLLVPNMALALMLLPIPHAIRLSLAVLAAICLAAFVPVMIRAILLGVRARKAARARGELLFPPAGFSIGHESQEQDNQPQQIGPSAQGRTSLLSGDSRTMPTVHPQFTPLESEKLS